MRDFVFPFTEKSFLEGSFKTSDQILKKKSRQPFESADKYLHSIFFTKQILFLLFSLIYFEIQTTFMFQLGLINDHGQDNWIFLA